jgi:uncharacterized protein
MNPVDIISEYYKPSSEAYAMLLQHGESVARKALDAAAKIPNLNPDLTFIQEAAMLHDIAIFMTDAPELGCTGKHPYICHGYLGRELLENKGLFRHAMVCDRHVGVGITAEEIKHYNLPLPARDMVPISIEEQVICFADKFFSKNGLSIENEKPVAEILGNLARYGPDKVKIFESWIRLFS